MGGLRKTLAKVPKLGHKLSDPFGHLGVEKKLKGLDEGIDEGVFGPAEVENPNPELPKVIEMPDEEAIKKARRRGTSQRRGSGRAGTILSDRLGG